MNDALNRTLATLPASVEVCLFVSDAHGVIYQHNATTAWPAASLIKLGIAAYGHACWLKDSALLNQQLTLTDEERVGGAGVLRFMATNTYTIGDLLQLMLMQSDNTATNALIDCFGLANINTWLQSHYPGAVLGRRLMQAGAQNTLTAQAGAQLLAACFKPDDYWAVVQSALRHQVVQHKLCLATACGEFPVLTTYNKTGELAHYEHDAARFSNGEHWIDCVVLTHYETDRAAAIRYLQAVGRLVATSLC
ncbi:serine hydrolase [Lacticaseibacillus jixiensis]|uniref:serine hydrolase n=1 Tax=Lacticaseibacillus jixiensis TaxID=3231926 RepID=UPI0036F2162E